MNSVLSRALRAAITARVRAHLRPLDLRWALVVLTALSALQPVRAQLDPAAFVALGASVLRIEVLRKSGGYALGSAVVVAPNKVATNCHVTQEAREVRVLDGGVRRVAAAQSVDAEHDLCLLRVPGLMRDAVLLGSADALRIGQKLNAIGYTGGSGISNSAGAVIALHRHDGSRVIQTSNWFNSGASGGGLFDEQRQLVGILTFRLRGGRAHYFAAPVEWVRERLADDSRFEPVAPIDATRRAYWQRALGEQPNFLQAAVLEHDGRWSQLEALAASWASSDDGDAEPWYLRGVALAEQQRHAEAHGALERAVSLEPAFAPAWFRLGVVRQRLALRESALQALGALRALDAELAEQLAKLLEAA